jgi:hypothetical protein
MGRSYTKAELDFMDRIAEDMSDEQRTQLVEYRGGCSCHISPPCSACCEPVRLNEADDLGWFDDLNPA